MDTVAHGEVEADHRMLGAFFLHADVLDIGFSFLPGFEGKGFAYESAFKLKQVAAENFGVKKLSAITTKENFSSQKLIERLGLKFRKMVTIPEDDEELMYFEN